MERKRRYVENAGEYDTVCIRQRRQADKEARDSGGRLGVGIVLRHAGERKHGKTV